MKRIVFSMVLVLMFATRTIAQVSADSLMVIGTVINGADSNVLPLCKVHLLLNGKTMASAITDNDGYYMMNHVPVGDYTFLVTQFGDTLMMYKGLTISRSTLVKSVIQPPTGGFSSLPTLPVDGMIQLNTIFVSARRNLLYNMGLLITSPNDPRLWNFSGRMEYPGGANDCGGCCKRSTRLFHPGLDYHPLNSDMKNDIILHGRILDYACDSTTAKYKRWFLGIKF